MTYKDLYKTITANYTKDELTQVCKNLNKSYNIYDPEEIRWNKISYCLFNTSESEIKAIRQCVLSNVFINDLLFEYYVCERVVKYYLIKKLLKLKNDIVAFEMTIGDSRIDICRINGGSYAYEIKTEYDSYERLSSQMNDYMKAFERVYVIVPQFRANTIQSIIPPGCGIITYRQADNELVFSYYRRSKKNQCDISTCITSLSSSDLSDFLKLLGLHNKGSKEEKLKVLADYSNIHSVWPFYRKLLKEKYQENWHFLREHFVDIVPIDIQIFFSTSMSPSLFYESQKERS